jgi:multidrug efflux pump subunit AcrA (membrane-fusion protein)
LEKITKRITLMIIALVVLAAAGGFGYYSQVYLPVQVTPALTINTTKIRTGDISITASGVGSILPSEKVSIGFQMSGILTEIEVKVGDHVAAGQVLAKVDSLNTQAQLATDQLNLLSAQQALDELNSNLKNDQTSAQATLITAQKNLADANYYLNGYLVQRCDTASIALYNGDLILAQNNYAEALDNYNSFSTLSEFDERKIVAYQ